MMFQLRKGDLLIQSNKIIGFYKGINIAENYLIFHRAVSILSMDRVRFNQ